MRIGKQAKSKEGATVQKKAFWRLLAIVVAISVVVGVAAALGALVLTSSDDALEGEVWVVDQLTITGTSMAPIPGTILTAFFEEGVVSGVAGCNDYFGGYEVDGDTIAVTETGSTRAFCGEPEGTMDQEIAFLGLLEAVDGFEREGDGLILKDGDDPLITFVAGGYK